MNSHNFGLKKQKSKRSIVAGAKKERKQFGDLFWECEEIHKFLKLANIPKPSEIQFWTSGIPAAPKSEKFQSLRIPKSSTKFEEKFGILGIPNSKTWFRRFRNVWNFGISGNLRILADLGVYGILGILDVSCGRLVFGEAERYAYIHAVLHVPKSWT